MTNSTKPNNNKKTQTNKKQQKKTLPDLYALNDASMTYINHRIQIFNQIFKRQNQKNIQINQKITVKLPDNRSVSAIKGVTTPLNIAKDMISEEFARKIIICKVNDTLFDCFRPLESDCSLEFCDFNTEEGKHVFWHSSAHVLGQCMERLYSGKLTIGPALENCFYYDIDMENQKITESDYNSIEKLVQQIVKEKQRFQRIVMTKNEALEMFKYNKFKQIIIREKIPDDSTCTAYRCGPLIDLCRGPHIPNTGLIKAFSILKHSACYWKGNASNAQLQRIYAVSYPNKNLLKIRLNEIKLAKERDHRKIGQNQKLFFFHPLSAGSAFWLPHGAIIYNKLMDFIKAEYKKRGYSEVMSPNIYNMQLWETSGHALKYKKDMFIFESEGQEFAMKPMNCPGHCLMFKHLQVSYKNMPIRFADFGVLHRNELSGALSGLTRVRRFQQDDAHIFCTVDQIAEEVKGCLEFMKFVYGKFDFDFSLALSTRPKDYIGDISVWESAEAALEKSLNDFGYEWKVSPEDGAFYGPKIDILLHDALGRSIQCATVQLDFNLPSKERFDLEYHTPSGGKEHPVIVHRAILGSLERFIAILTEHCGGKWPFWISPRQAIVLPISDKFLSYALEIKNHLYDAGYHVDYDNSDNHIEKKVREAQLSQYNFILVVGQKELDAKTVNIRTRDNKRHGTKTLEEVLEWFERLAREFE